MISPELLELLSITISIFTLKDGFQQQKLGLKKFPRTPGRATNRRCGHGQ
jgi:hypothetical protein